MSAKGTMRAHSTPSRSAASAAGVAEPATNQCCKVFNRLNVIGSGVLCGPLSGDSLPSTAAVAVRMHDLELPSPRRVALAPLPRFCFLLLAELYNKLSGA